MENKYFEKLLMLATKAAKKNEVPVSALLILNDKIIATAYNTRHQKNNILNHAEILVIKKAAKKLKTWHLTECNLYVTLKPCPMCEALIKQSRIKNVYYLLDKLDYKKEYNKVNIVKANNSMYEKKYTKLLSGFFKEKRLQKKSQTKK